MTYMPFLELLCDEPEEDPRHIPAPHPLPPRVDTETLKVRKELYDTYKHNFEDEPYTYYEKDILVTTALTYLCKVISPDVIRLEYEWNEDTGEELVRIVYNTSAGEYKREINVTADSLSALARDVLKYI